MGDRLPEVVRHLLKHGAIQVTVVRCQLSVVRCQLREEATGRLWRFAMNHGLRTSRRKKPWRYRWSDEFRDEVLARLLALNKERGEQERLAGQLAVVSCRRRKGEKPPRKRRSPPNAKPPALPGF